MTHDEQIAVIQAHKLGKAIQFCTKGTGLWTDLHPICFGANFTDYDYRVKPEPKVPREFWMCRDLDKTSPYRCGWRLYDVKQAGVDPKSQIHVREVLEDE